MHIDYEEDSKDKDPWKKQRDHKETQKDRGKGHNNHTIITSGAKLLKKTKNNYNDTQNAKNNYADTPRRYIIQKKCYQREQ